MNITKERFQEILGTLEPVFKMRDPLEQSHYVCFDDQRIFSYCSSMLSLNRFDFGFTCAVKAEKLNDVVEKMPGEEIEINCEDNYLTLQSGSTKSKINLVDYEFLVNVADKLDKGGNVEAVELPSNLLEGIDFVKDSTMDASPLDWMKGVVFCNQQLLSSDNVRSSRFLLDGDIGTVFVLPSKNIQNLSKLPVERFWIDGSWVYLESFDMDYLCVVKRIDPEKLPNEKLFAKAIDFDGETVNLPSNMEMMVERASIFTDNEKTNKFIRIELEKGVVRCIGEQQGEGEIVDETEIEYDNGKISFYIMPHLLKTLSNLKGRELIIGERGVAFHFDEFSQAIAIKRG